jgi:hypothetical protein
VLGDQDQLGPGAVVHLRAAVGQEPEHLVPDGVAGDRRAGLLDHPGVVTAKDDRELVLDHALAPAGENPRFQEGW